MSVAGKSLALLVLSGRKEGTLLPLRSGQVLRIGRMEGLDLVLPEDLVSRRHAEIAVTDEGIVLRDLGSTNGTFVNGRRIREVALKEGDRVLVGATILSVVPQEEMLLPTGTSLAEALSATAAVRSAAPEEEGAAAVAPSTADLAAVDATASAIEQAESTADEAASPADDDFFPPDATIALAEKAPPLSQLSPGELDLVQACLVFGRLDRVLERAGRPDARELIRGLVDRGYLAVRTGEGWELSRQR